MATDWVRLFDLGLVQRLVKLDRRGLERWLDQNLGGLMEKACRRAEQQGFGREACEEYASQWEQRRDEVRGAPPGPLPTELRDPLVEEAAMEGESELLLDYWACMGIAFDAGDVSGEVQIQELLPTRVLEPLRGLSAAPPGPAYPLLGPALLDRMIRSLREHRDDWTLMTDEKLRRLADFRERCAWNAALRVAYFVDY